MRKRFTLIALLLASQWLVAQELNTTVKINTQKLLTVDAKVFGTLEQSIREFMNNQKWTDDVYERDERIDCNMLLTIQEELSPTSFKAELAIQVSRPGQTHPAVAPSEANSAEVSGLDLRAAMAVLAGWME